VDADPKILIAAEKLLLERGYHQLVLADIATEANVALPAIQMHFPNKADILHAVLEKNSPEAAIRAAFRQLRQDTPEHMVRELFQKFLEILDAHSAFAAFAMIDAQATSGVYITTMFTRVASETAGYLNRLSTMHRVRPVSSIVLARTLASLMVGFVVTQQLAPQNAQFAMRVMPNDAWVDGMVNIFLHGILEDE